MRSSVTRLVPGPGLTNAGSRVTLMSLKLEPGYSYHVELPVTVRHTNPDAVDYVAVSLLCKDAAGHSDTIGQAVNTLRGTTFTLTPRLYITIHKKFPGSNARGGCYGYAQATRIQGSRSASPSSRSISVLSAKLIVYKSAAYADVHETVRFKGNNYSSSASNPYAGHSSRVSTGSRFHAAPVAFTLNNAKTDSFSLTGNVYLTACTSAGGSRDATTNDRNLCASVFKVIKAGPKIRTRMIVQQFRANGTTACRTVVVPNTTKTFHITSMRHHLPVLLTGTLTLPKPSASARCGSHAKAYTEVYVESSPAVVVHFPSSVTSVLPV